jgi:protoporphyrinogen IX oxidase
MSYPLIKALHLIFMVAWFSGLFYIFRLFVYVVMERRLLFGIMHPAMFFTLAFGFTLLVKNPEFLQHGWIHAKLLAIFGLIGYQAYAGYVRRRMAHGIYPLSEKACRIINEVPTVLLIVIVLLAVLRPF